MQQKSSSNHIDKNVILILLSVILVSSGILGFKVLNHTPCQVVNFEIEAQQYRVGEIIRFKDYTEDVTGRKWDFGDESEMRYTENPFHTYDKPGTYNIVLMVNDKCDLEKQITIEEKLEIIDSTLIANFEIPKSIIVGELLKANDFTKKATSWEWRFGETSEVNSRFQNPTYVYETPGLKTVTLIVNDDPRYSSQQVINVLPKQEEVESPKKTKSIAVQNRERESLIKYDPTVVPKSPTISKAPEETKPAPVAKAPTPAPKKEVVPKISRSAFAKKVISVGEEKATANDFKPYLCGNLQVTTMDRGKKTTFIEFCEKIKGKKLKIKSLEIFKNEKTECIEYISIDYSKGIF